MTNTSFYTKSATLLNRLDTDRTTAVYSQTASDSQALINGGDLSPWFVRMELTHTGINTISNGVLTLLVDKIGTFSRATPLLMTSDAKFKYLIELRISQIPQTYTLWNVAFSYTVGQFVTWNSDYWQCIQSTSNPYALNPATDPAHWVPYGFTLRGQLDTAEIQEDEEAGEVIRIQLTGIQYIAKETPMSSDDFFVTPYQRFKNLIDIYNGPGGPTTILSPIPPIVFNMAYNNLPNDQSLKDTWKPFEPTPFHELLVRVIDKLVLPPVLGGTFTDYFFDYVPDTITTTQVNIVTDVLGGVDSGVVVTPLPLNSSGATFSQSGGQQDKSLMTSHTQYKNGVILIGNRTAGSLPMDSTRFGSKWLHVFGVNGQGGRPEWISGTYQPGSVVQRTIKTVTPNMNRAFALKDTVPYNSVTAPESDPTHWREDWTIIPEFILLGKYTFGDIITVTNYSSDGKVRFYQLITPSLWADSGYSYLDKVAWGGRYYICISAVGAGSLVTPPVDIIHWNPVSNVYIGISPPPTDGANWSEITPRQNQNNYQTYQTYTPWTVYWAPNGMSVIGLGFMYANMVGLTNPPSGRVGWFYDWNIVRTIYDPRARPDPTNQFENVSVKYVTKILNTPPSGGNVRDIYQGQRYLIGTSPSGAFTADFATQGLSGTAANRVAQYDMSDPLYPNGIWKFSIAPQTGDIVNNLDDATVLTWNGSAWIVTWGYDQSRTLSTAWNGTVVDYAAYSITSYGGLNYTAQQDIPANAGNQNPSLDHRWSSSTLSPYYPVNIGLGSAPFHPITTISSVTGASGIPLSGVEFRFDWDTIKGPDLNAHSRGAWISFMFPYPRITNTQPGGGYSTVGPGDLYGGNFGKCISTFDINNYNYNHQGIIGWNQGSVSEDLGQVSSMSFKLRLSLWSDIDETILLSFQSDIQMIWWGADLFDRVYYFPFKLRRNGQWDLITVSLGDNSPQNLYFARWGELPMIWLIIIPFDFLIAEREFTGVHFDWRFLKMWGIMYKDSYDFPSGFYKNAQSSGLDQIASTMQQGVGATLNWYANAAFYVSDTVNNFYNRIVTFFGQHGIPLPNNPNKPGSAPTTSSNIQIGSYIHHANIAIDDLKFDKELIVNSNQITINNPRYIIEHNQNETDYYNLLAESQALQYRSAYVLQAWHMRAIGDVRMRFGQLFTIAGSRVPGGAQKVFCKEVKHIIDGSGYFMEVYGIKKFTLITIAANPGSGKVGSTITLTGSGFATPSTITVKFNGSTMTTTPGTVNTDAIGSFVCTFSVPSIANGIYTISATDGAGGTTTTQYTVTS